MAVPSAKQSGDNASLALAREFHACPIGHHGSELTALLSLLRSVDTKDKHCLICVRPHEAWAIGRMSGKRGIPPVVADNRIFATVEAAEWAVFKLRWAAFFGVPLDDDLL